MFQYDLTILAGARPELLARTLSSFQIKVFDENPPKNIYANIDPWGMGDITRNVFLCKKIIEEYFPNSVINLPQKPNFAGAVKFLWALPESGQFLHLEDDWVAQSNIYSDRALSLLKEKTTQVQLVRPPREEILLTRKRYRPKFQFKRLYIPDFSFPCFTTSPSFLDTAFAHGVADLIDDQLHPEKQMFNGMNLKLESYVRDFSSISLNSFYMSQSIFDTGTPWQAKNGIRRDVIEGKLIYTTIPKT